MSSVPAATLRGRRVECATLERLLAGARSGRSGVLMVRGEAGVGKTALLDYLLTQAEGAGSRGRQGSNRRWSFRTPGCTSSVPRCSTASMPSRRRSAPRWPPRSGCGDGDAPDRFLVGLAMLSLLSDAAEEQPLLCVVDDAQWLDRASAQALAFVARRLWRRAGRDGLRGAKSGDAPDARGPAELVVRGAGRRRCAGVAGLGHRGPLDQRVRDRIVAETRGNPLALLELPRGVKPEDLAGGFGLPDAGALSSRIEESFRRRVIALPPSTRLLLLIAAADPVGDPLLVWRAAERLGVDARGRSTGGRGGRVGVRRRRFASATRWCAPRSTAPRVRSERRRGAPGARRGDRTRRPIPTVARGTVRTPRRARRGRRRRARALGRPRAGAWRTGGGGGVPRAGGRADARPGAARRARADGRAEQARRPGRRDAAMQLLAMARGRPAGRAAARSAELLRAQITFARPAAATRRRCCCRPRGGSSRSTRRWLARRTSTPSPPRCSPAVWPTARGMRDVAEAVLAAELAARRGDRRAPVICSSMAWRVLRDRGLRGGAPTLQRALAAFRDEPMSEDDALRWLWLANHVARALGDDASWDEFTERQVQLARRTGALALLPLALTERSTHAAVRRPAERRAVARGGGRRSPRRPAATSSPHAALFMAAYAGNEDEAAALIDASAPDVDRRGEGLWLIVHRVDERAAVQRPQSLRGGPGSGRAARRAAIRARPRDVGRAGADRGSRAERPTRACRAPMAEFAEIAGACGTDWALGVEARARALLTRATRPSASTARRSSGWSGRGIRVALARAHLLYGEWLRRQRRRVDAREQLHIAHEMFVANGMDGFAERARRELIADR